MTVARTTVGEGGGRLVDYAKAHLAVVDVRRIGPLIAAGSVTIDDRVAAIADPVRSGDVLGVSLAALAVVDPLVPAPMTLTVAYEDDDLVVVDKPAGMHVHPIGPFRGGTVINALLSHAGARVDQPWAAWRPRPVHRLDRATSGLVVVDKPAGMHVHPIGPFRAGTVINELLSHAGARVDQPWAAWRPRPVHRLDRATSGLVAIAKHAEIHDAMRRLFRDDHIRRRYRAVVTGQLVQDAGTIDAPLGRDPACTYRRAVVAGGERAITHYRVVGRQAARTIVELELETGRTHQIRAHLASIGHPIVGDTLYETGGASSAAIGLRAVELVFPHPRHGNRLRLLSVA